MQFKKIHEAYSVGGSHVEASDLTLNVLTNYRCLSCGNPLRLHWTHTGGRYFSHILQLARMESLLQCDYLIPVGATLYPKPLTPFASGVQDVLQRDNATLGFPEPQRFVCVMCNHEYDGLKMCPLCNDWMYTTELKNRCTDTPSNSDDTPAV